MEKEPIEEAADSYSSNPIFRMGTPRQDMKRGFELGAKWQAERMYSEEDMMLAWEDGRNGLNSLGIFPFYQSVFKNKTFNEWFKKFKKK